MQGIQYRMAQTLAACALVATVLVPSAWAEKKFYPGHMCKPAITSQAEDFQFSAADGSIRNGSSLLNLDVICPVVRDRTSGRPRRIEILVKPAVSTFDPPVRCEFFSYSKDGASSQTRSLVTQSRDSVKQSLVITRPLSQPAGAYSLLCTLAPTAELFSYTVDE